MLEQQILSLQEAGSHRKRQVISNVNQGRVISRLVLLFEPIEDLIGENNRCRALELSAEDDADEDEQLIEYTKEEQRTHRGYNLLVKNVSPIETKLVEFDTHELGVYFRELRKGAAGARGDDAANLKPSIINWIATLVETPAPALDPTTKSDRGFEHDATGRLLCPVDYQWEDTSVRQKIRDGHPDFPVTGDSWPSFLYPHARGDENDVEKGLLRSAILIKAYKFIFTSPTSAKDVDCEIGAEDHAAHPHKRARTHKAPTRGHIANIMRMKAVTPRSIAYVAVQVRG
ncbi:hypothetical protein BDZ94DRAFT_1309465 [Collybia nuda]|uniref:Uncharacterized protein n=1 Tax=Collybia nuda TaxID=64659 RepID=A0A9P5Y5F7_9AGAR|nr:hypothetical protein BDZ94DRAFT_1309465 [Collybia nuda]